MVRTAIVNDNLLNYLSTVSKEHTYAVGLILGQSCLGKDYIIHFAKTPPCQSEEDKKENKPTKDPESIEDFNNVWLSDHARQATRMLPGGLYVLGIFVVSPTDILNPLNQKIKSLLNSIHIQLNSNEYLFGSSGSEKLIFHVYPKTLKYFCKSYDVNTHSVQPVDVKTLQKKWINLQCDFMLDNFRYLSKNQKDWPLDKHIKIILDDICDSLKTAVFLFEGELKDKDDSLESLGKKKNRNNRSNKPAQEGPENPLQVSIFQTKKSSLPMEETSFDLSGKLRLIGKVACKLWLQPKLTISEASAAIKEDILRSLTSRLEMHWDSLLEEENLEDINSVHEPPRRVLISLPDSEIAFSDYLFPGEGPQEAKVSLEELLDVKIDGILNIKDIEGQAEPEDSTPKDDVTNEFSTLSEITDNCNSDTLRIVYVSCKNGTIENNTFKNDRMNVLNTLSKDALNETCAINVRRTLSQDTKTRGIYKNVTYKGTSEDETSVSSVPFEIAIDEESILKDNVLRKLTVPSNTFKDEKSNVKNALLEVIEDRMTKSNVKNVFNTLPEKITLSNCDDDGTLNVSVASENGANKDNIVKKVAIYLPSTLLKDGYALSDTSKVNEVINVHSTLSQATDMLNVRSTLSQNADTLKVVIEENSSVINIKSEIETISGFRKLSENVSVPSNEDKKSNVRCAMSMKSEFNYDDTLQNETDMVCTIKNDVNTFSTLSNVETDEDNKFKNVINVQSILCEDRDNKNDNLNDVCMAFQDETENDTDRNVMINVFSTLSNDETDEDNDLKNVINVQSEDTNNDTLNDVCMTFEDETDDRIVRKAMINVLSTLSKEAETRLSKENVLKVDFFEDWKRTVSFFIRELLNAEKVDEDFVCKNVKFTRVFICGFITKITQIEDYLCIEVDDSTGNIKCLLSLEEYNKLRSCSYVEDYKEWLRKNSKNDSSFAKAMRITMSSFNYNAKCVPFVEDWLPGNLVKLHGTLKEYDDGRKIFINKINKQRDECSTFCSYLKCMTDAGI